MSFSKLNQYKNTDYPEDLVVPKGNSKIANYIKNNPEKNVNSNECACVIVRTEDNRFLFMQTAHLNHNQTVENSSIEFPGGRIVYGEKRKVGACREFGEETGLTLNPNDLIEITNQVFHYFPKAKSKKNNKHYYICEIPYTSKELEEKIKDRNNGIDADRGIPIFYLKTPNELKALENLFSDNRKDNYLTVLAIDQGNIKYNKKNTSKSKMPLNGNYVEKHTKNKKELIASNYDSLNEKLKNNLYELNKKNHAIVPKKIYTRHRKSIKRRGSAVDLAHNACKNEEIENNLARHFENQYKKENTIKIVKKIQQKYQAGCISGWGRSGMSDDLTQIVKHAKGKSWFFSGDNTYQAILAATNNKIDVRYKTTEEAVTALQNYTP